MALGDRFDVVFLLLLAFFDAWMAWSSGGVLAKVGDCSWPPPDDLYGVLVPSPWEITKGNSSGLLVACGSSSCVGCAAPNCGLGV